MQTPAIEMPRRKFLAGTVAAGALTAFGPSFAFGQASVGRVVEIGLIGCGGRGSWIADLFAAEKSRYKLVACADYFQDKVDAIGSKFAIGKERRYTGLSGYKRLLESKLDAVVIETPPYFHPQQASDSVDAGKHVFLAKPIAVDAPGCMQIADAGRRATEKKLAFVVDFQTRANDHFRSAMRQVHEGAIGKLVMVEAFYPWSGGGRGEPPATTEEQLRNWYYVLPLSGDFIVEQSIHSLDVATWIINSDPISASGMGGHKVRPGKSIYDHFALTYRFADDLLLSFTCIQSIPMIKDEIRARAYGSDGFVDVDYFGTVHLRGKEAGLRESVENLYTTGTQVNIREFQESIVRGNYLNETVAPSVRSNLTAILGREAAYRRKELTLKELIAEGQKLKFDTSGLKS